MGCRVTINTVSRVRPLAGFTRIVTRLTSNILGGTIVPVETHTKRINSAVKVCSCVYLPEKGGIAVSTGSIVYTLQTRILTRGTKLIVQAVIVIADHALATIG